MKKILSAISCAVLSVTLSAQCLVIEVPLQQRATASSVIVEGKVISQYSYWNDAHNMIYTSNVVELYKIFKGTPGASSIEIITEGGTVGMDRITLEPTLEMSVGDVGVFTCIAVQRAVNIPATIVTAPRYEAYASLQGFIEYDTDADLATDHFRTYADLQTEIYNVVCPLRSFTVVQNVDPMNPPSPLHNGPPPAVQAISNISPTTITAGTGSQLTITGTGFGAVQGSGSVRFRNADDGGATVIAALNTEIISWSDTQVIVEVPAEAGTGTVQVVQGPTQTSAQTLTISYAHLNVQFNPGTGTEAYGTDHVNDNGTGGYTWRMNTAFDADVAMRASFMRAFDTWRCATNVNWTIGATTSINDAVSDGTNIITEDIAAPLSPGILGVCYSYWSGCANGPTIVWFVNELDIIFDDGSNISPLTWEYGPALPSGSEYDFETVAVHELGHGHQLGHVISNGAIMHYAISNGTSNRALGANDLAGGQFVQAKSVVGNICGPGAMTNFSCASPPVAAFSGTPTTVCPGGTVAFTDLSTNTPTGWSWTFTGGTPGTSSAQNPTITYNTPGTYQVSLTASNVSGSDNQTNVGYITVTSSVTVGVVSQTNVSCFGGSNGAASVSASGGSGGYAYNWTPGNPTGDGTTSVSGLSAGSWTCTVTDAIGCVGTRTFNVTAPSAIVVSPASQTNISCFGGSNGAASINTPTGGAGGYTFNWTPGNPTGDGTVSVTALTAGTWTCTVTDANSCVATQTFNITAPSALVASSLSQTNVSCSGGTNGAASVSATGGTPSYSYNWTPGNPTGDGTASVTGLISGTWTCTVTDANSCVVTRTFNITAPTALVVAPVSQTNVSCGGGSNGAASVSASGGTPSYSYNWTPGNPTGDGTVSVSGLTSGTWTCTVTDANSCVTTQTFNITQPSSIVVTPVSQTNISCNGGSNGAASVSVSGGAGGNTFNWTPGNPTGDGTASVTGLNAGTWTCTVTDINSCTGTTTFNVTAPSALVASALSQTNISCNGGSNGAASVAVTGGTTSYSYNWTPGNPTGDGTASVTGLSVGTWTCTVTDANSCVTTQTFNITAPSVLVASSASQTNTSCNGGSNGAASVSVSGGTTSYSYNWTPGNPAGDGTASVTGLISGTWTCTVTDANSCVTTQTFSITQPTAIVASPGSTPESCSGNDGTASVSPAGGTPGYTYSWAPSGGTGSIATGLAAGNYTCTITDANSCVTTGSTTVAGSGGPSASIFSQTNASCSISCDGAATVLASGGAGGYTYSWSPSGGSAATASGLCDGGYICTVTDALSCVTTATVLITAPLPISVPIISQTNISCNGGSNGAATVGTSGGTPGYSYNWTPGNPTGDGTASVTGLTAGTWTCTVTDANLCVATRTLNITAPSALAVTPLSQTNIACNAGNTGAASVSVSGGAGGNTFNWTPGSPTGDGTASVTNLTAGTWTCSVTDANGCNSTATFSLTQPTAISVSSTATPESCTGNDGTASVSPSGGTPGYSFSWAPSGGTASTATGITAGNYTCTVTDANGCTATPSVTVTGSGSAPSVSIASSSNVSCFGGNNGSATVNVTGGATPYSYAWTPSGGTAANANGLAAGTYTCTVTDNNGCVGTETVTITSPTVLSVSIVPVSAICNGQNANLVSSVSGGVASYTYNWLPGSMSTANVTVNPSTTTGYTVTVTDANGCTATGTSTVTVNPLPTLTITSTPSNSVVCSGNQATLTASGAQSYSWTGGITNGVAFTPVSTTTYTVTGTSSNGCTSTSQSTVTVNNCSSSTVPCGVTITDKSQSISAVNVPSATQYRFRFYDNVTLALVGSSTIPTRTLVLNTVPNIVYGRTYRFTVAVNTGSGFGTESSMNCTVTLAIPVTTLPCNQTYNRYNGYSAVPSRAGVVGYRYSFYDNVTSALVAQVTNASSYIYFNTVSQLTVGTTYKWSVEVQYYNGTANVFGPASNVNCIVTMAAPTATVPCGGTYNRNTGYSACPVTQAATGYRFTFYQSSVMVAQRSQTSNYIYFNQVTGINNGQTYQWTVEVQYNPGSGNVFGPPSAPCNITFSSSARQKDPLAQMEESTNENADFNFGITMYPNPIGNGINPTLNITGADQQNAFVTVMDLTGRTVATYNLFVEGDEYSTQLAEFPDLVAGMYIMQVQVGDKVQSQKFIAE